MGEKIQAIAAEMHALAKDYNATGASCRTARPAVAEVLCELAASFETYARRLDEAIAEEGGRR